MDQKVCLITGASKGLGFALAKEFADQGYRVFGTTRSSEKVDDSLALSKNITFIEVDLLAAESITAGVAQVLSEVGHVDTLINNAGYGLFGAVEEASDEEVKDNFAVNLYGLLNVTKAILPSMRQRKSGHIMNIASIGGYVGSFPGVGVYCSTKFAVAGVTEGLKADLEGTGIDVTVVYPGYFRTNFLSKESMKVAKQQIVDYAAAHEVVQAHRIGINKNQPGDPKKFAKVMCQATEMKPRPFHLFLGSDSLEYAKDKIQLVQSELDKYRSLSLSTDFE